MPLKIVAAGGSIGGLCLSLLAHSTGEYLKVTIAVAFSAVIIFIFAVVTAGRQGQP